MEGVVYGDGKMLPPPALEQANDQGCARYRARQPDARVNECNRDVSTADD